MTDRELVTAPPHRVDHEIVSGSATGGGGTGDTQGNATLFRYSGGAGGIKAVAGPPTLLTLAVQVSCPEDPATPEGRLVQTLQDEEESLSTRVKALKVRAGYFSRMTAGRLPGGQVGGEETGETDESAARALSSCCETGILFGEVPLVDEPEEKPQRERGLR